MNASTNSAQDALAPLARMIAFYLPQYHPVPENDVWWGPGFTEWTNTAKARPLFPGHRQPHLPSELGFYDLRVPETREHQARLAREHGIEGFCYYHYWFGGRRILERPFQEMLGSGEPDFPFCICWANETWSGIWHGAPKKVLLEQTYPGEADTRAHFETLLPAFRDPRYIKVDGKPLFLIYKPGGLPDQTAQTALWRRLAEQAGLPGLFFIGLGAHGHWDPVANGFDASISPSLPPVRPWFAWSDPVRKVRFAAQKWRDQPTIYRYKDVVRDIFPRPFPAERHYPVVVPNWDNTPRSGPRGRVLHGATPALFREHLHEGLSLIARRPREHRLVFLKSWNEWAEGNYVEPDMEYGRQWLEAIRDELLPHRPNGTAPTHS